MRTILGIDAAWTTTEPSGVALLAEQTTGWTCMATAPSYLEFLAQAEGKPTNWSQRSFAGTRPDVPSLLRAAERLSGLPVDLVAIDMPIAKVRFASRRPADDAISREFGSRWCSAHTPSSSRPGLLGEALSGDLTAAGFSLTTSSGSPPDGPQLIEVYPHPALLSLLKRDQRVPYKVSKSGKYWPSLSHADRISALLIELEAIHSALTLRLGPLPFELPDQGSIASLSMLKRYEDALDALVCAWVGAEYLAGRTIALGDELACVWCPADVVHTHAPQQLPGSRL